MKHYKFFVLLLFSSFLILAPGETSFAQTPTPLPLGGAPDVNITIPPNSPWWAAIVVALVGLLIWAIRAYIESQLKKRDREFDLKLAQLKSQSEGDQSDARKTEALATSISMMAESNNALARSVTEAVSSFAKDRLSAAQEREGFRMTLNQNNQELEKLRTSVGALVENTNAVKSQVDVIQARIGGTKDDPTLTDMIREALAATRQAAEVLEASASIAQPTPNANGEVQGG